MQVTLTAANGTLTLSGTTGLSFTAGDGTGDSSDDLHRHAGDINTALDGLSFLPTANFSGSDTLTITTNDQGNTGSGGPRSDTDTVAITVTAVNDAPVNTVPGAHGRVEDTAQGRSPACRSATSEATTAQVTLTVANGTLTLGSTSRPDLRRRRQRHGDMTFTGTLAAINTALNSLSFLPAARTSAAATPDDHHQRPGHTGSGGAQADIDTVAITVGAVNDAPVNNVPGLRARTKTRLWSSPAAWAT